MVDQVLSCVKIWKHHTSRARKIKPAGANIVRLCWLHALRAHLFIIEIADAGRDGRRLSANAGDSQAAQKKGGKSELHRAACRITSGREPSKALDGKCHRENTAPACRGKGEKVR